MFNKRFISFILSFIIIFSLFSVFISNKVSATEDTSSDIFGGAVEALYFDSDNYLSDIEEWTVTDDSNSSITTSGDAKSMRISSKGEKLNCELVFDIPLDVSLYSEIGLYLRSVSKDGCRATLTVYHNGGISSYTSSFSTGTEYYLFSKIPENTVSVSKITLSVNSDNKKESSPSVILRGAVLSEIDHTKNIQDFSAFSVEGIGDDNNISEGTPVVVGPMIFDDSAEKAYAVKITLKGHTGNINLNYSEDGKNFTVCGSSLITENRTCYIYAIENWHTGAHLKLDFIGIGDVPIIIEGISLIPIRDIDITDSQCTISKSFYNSYDNILNIAGTISRDTVIEHINGKICLFEYPLWETDISKVLSSDPIDRTDMTTSFNFSTSVSKDHFPFYSYIIAIDNAGKINPISNPIFPSTSTTQVSHNISSSVTGVPCEEAFIFGYDNYVIDIGTEKFFFDTDKGNCHTFTYDDNTYYIDKEFVSDITKKTVFLSATDVGIIFDLSSVSFDAESETGCRVLSAIVAYLSKEYSPSGFIIGNAVSHLENNDISDSAYNTAALIRLIYATASNSCMIYTPIDAGDTGEAFAWFLSDYLKKIPTPNFEMLITNTADDPQGAINGIKSSAISGGYNSHYSALIDSNRISVSKIHKDLSDSAVSLIIRGDSRTSINIPHDTWNEYSVISMPVSDNSVDLWNFTKSYDSGGFIMSPESSGIFTETNDLLSNFTSIPLCRSIRTVLKDSSRILVAKSPTPLQLTNAPYVRFVLDCVSDAPFSLDFIFISGKERAVFTAEYKGSGVYSPVCDLTDTNVVSKIDKIAVALRDGTSVSLGIAYISVESTNNDPNAVSTIYLTEAPQTAEKPVSQPQKTSSVPTVKYAAMGFAVIMTIVVFAVLSVRKT